MMFYNFQVILKSYLNFSKIFGKKTEALPIYLLR